MGFAEDFCFCFCVLFNRKENKRRKVSFVFAALLTGIAACLQTPDSLIIRYISSSRQGFRQNRCKQVNNRRYMQKTLTNRCQRWIGRMYALLNGSVSEARIARSGNENKKSNVSVVGADYLCRDYHERKNKKEDYEKHYRFRLVCIAPA